MKKYHLYIVLTRTNTVISRLIRIVKNDEYTHASISFNKELTQMYSFGRRNTYNPFIGRFRQEHIHEGIYKLCTTLPCQIIEVEVTLQQYTQAQDLLDQFICNHYRYKYNYIGLLHSLINKPAYHDYRFLCSEFVYYILNESGVVDLNISRNLVRPQSLMHINGKTIYKGDLKKFDHKKLIYVL